MANIRFETEIESLNGIKYKVQIYDKNYTGSASDFSLGSAPLIKFDSAGADKFNEILASKCELEFVLENSSQVTFWENSFRSSTYTERDVYIFIYQFLDTYELMWTGYILQDLSTTEDVTLPKSILLQAVDGLSILKEIPFVPDALNAGTSPFAENETYIPAGTSPTNADSTTWGSGQYHRMSLWIAEVLGYAGVADSSLSNASINDYGISISANWYNTKMDATEIQTNDTFFLTAINARQFYKANEASGSNNDVNYNSMSCYDALRNMLRCFGSRIFYWNHKFYVIQIGLYATLETGTTSSPQNIKTQLYNKAGVKQSSGSLVGNNGLARYFIQTTSSRPTTPGGLKKLSGTTYDDFPVYKKAMTSFTSVSNLNLFNSFVLIPGQTNNPPSMVGGFSGGNQIAAIDTAFEDIGTFTDAKDFTGFFVNIFVKFKNGSGSGNVYFFNNWTIQAKPNSVSSWDTSATLVPVVLVNNTTNAVTLEWHEAINFSTFNPNTQSLQFRNTYGKASAVPSGHTAKNPFSSKIYVDIGQSIRSVVANTAIANEFNFVLPTASVMSGDWDFRFFAAVHARAESPLTLKYRHRGHGVQNFNPTSSFGRPPFAASAVPTLLAPGGDGGDISYQVMSSYNSYQSAFAVVSGGQIASYASHTNVTLNTDASYVKQVPDTLWGDTLNTNAPGSLYIDAGSSFEFTSFTGQWGKNTLSGTDSLTELLLKEVLFHNTVKTFKGNFTFALSNTNRDFSSNTKFPKQLSPLTIVQDIDFSNRKFVMLNGSWNLITNEVAGSWFEYLYDSQSTTVRSIDTGIGGTVNTGGGGTIGVGNNDPIDIGSSTGFTPPSPSNLVSSGFINTTSSSVSARLSGNVTDFDDGSIAIKNRFNREPFTFTTGVILSGAAITTIPIDGTTVQADTFKQGDILLVVDNVTQHKFTIATDVAEGATSLTVSSTTLEEDIPPGAFIYPDQDDLYVQYQHKSRGSIGNFQVSSTGMQSGSVNITSYIDDDSFGTASANSLATSESIKAYVDTQVGTVDTLEEVTANGNSTSYGIEFTSTNFSIGQAKIGLLSGNNMVYLRGGSGGLMLQNGSGTGAHSIQSSGNHIFEVGSTEKMRLNSTGLGIGTSNPVSVLEIKSSGANGLVLGQDNNVSGLSSRLFFTNATASQGVAMLNLNSNLTFLTGSNPNSTSGSERMRLTSGGNVLINSTTDDGSSKLQVNGAATFANDIIHLGDSDTKIRFTTDNIRLQTGGFNTLELDSSGNATFSGKLTINTTSDNRLNLVVNSSDTSDWNYIQFIGSDGVRDSFFGTDNVGTPIWSNNDLSNKIRLNSDSVSFNKPITVSDTVEATSIIVSDSIRHSGDSDTQIAFDTDTIKFDTGGSERARITSSGSLLIGTTSGSENIVVGATHPKIKLVSNPDPTSYFTTIESNYSFSGPQFRIASTNGQASREIFGRYANNLAIMKDGGNVGIGTSSPAYNLDTTGNIRATGYVYADDSLVTNTIVSAGTQDLSIVKSGAFSIKFLTNGSERARITSDGRLGLGTSSPNMPLSIENSDDFLAFFKSTDNKGFIGIADNDTTGYISAENDRMSFGAATGVNANNLNINLSNNNVGIGTSSPVGRLTVIDSTASSTLQKFHVGRGTTSGLSITDDDATAYIRAIQDENESGYGNLTLMADDQNNKDGYISFNGTAGVERARITSSGNLLLNTTTDDGSNKLQVSGNIKVGDSNHILIGNSSDFDLYHTGTNSFIENWTGDLYIRNNSNGNDVILQCDDGSGGVTSYITLDGSATRTVFSKDALFSDNVNLAIGDSLDLFFVHTGTHSFITQQGAGNLYIRNLTNDKDIIFQSDDGSGGVTTYITIDGSSHNTKFQKDLRIVDNVSLTIGNENDLILRHNTINSEIINNTGNLEIRNQFDNGDIVFKSDDGSGGVETYFYLDGGNNNIIFEKDILFLDNEKAIFGVGSDLRIYHNGTNSNIENFNGTLQIVQTVDDEDIVFRCDDGSGNHTPYITLDGSTTTTKFSKDTLHQDNVKGIFGTSDDLKVYHDSSNSYIENNTGSFFIMSRADDADLVLMCDDGSGGDTAYLTLDGGLGYTTVQKRIRFNDDISLALGSDNDLQLSHDATNSYISNSTGNLEIINNADDKDIIFKGDNGAGGVTTYFKLDGSLATHDGSSTTNVFTKWEDNSVISIGTSNDARLYHNGIDTYLDNLTGDYYIRQKANDKDLILQCDDGSGGNAAYIILDGSNTQTVFQKRTVHQDNIEARFGNGSDMKIYHNATDNIIETFSGDLYIRQQTDDKDIIFQCDNGGGGTTAYLTLDGSDSTIRVDKKLVLPDNIRTTFGGGEDLQLQHNGTDSFIDNYTGDLYLRNFANDKDIIFQSDDGSGSVETFFFLDGSHGGNPITMFPDNSAINFGSSLGDLKISHDGSNSTINNGTGALVLRQSVDDGDLLLQCDNGSGGTTAYITLDGSQTTVNISKNLLLNTTTDSGGSMTISGNIDFIGSADKIHFKGSSGGNNEGILYKDSGGSQRYGLLFAGSNVVALANRAANGTVQIRANTSTAGTGGEITVAEFEDSLIKLNKPVQVSRSTTPSDPPANTGVIYLDSNFDLKIKINGSEGVVTRTLAQYES